MQEHPTNSTQPSTQPSKPHNSDLRRLQDLLKDPLLQRVLGACQQRVQSRILSSVGQLTRAPQALEALSRELAYHNGQSELLAAMISGAFESFALEVLGITPNDIEGFQPYMRQDID